jgi:Tfp pilus assembly protein PilX
MIINSRKQCGAVSLFIVVFAALLITIVTVSFVRIMLQDQQQASTTDLSQSAYDSAQAGVEDAKRALLRYQSICNNSGGDECVLAAGEISSLTCNDAVKKLEDVAAVAAASENGEVNVQTGSSDNTLDQAYTCVTISLNTDDYLGTLSSNEPNIIPLVGVDRFDTIQIQWFNSANAGSNTVNLRPVDIETPPLLSQISWPSSRPPIMRTQIIQFGDQFNLGDFEYGDGNVGSNANTLFLYPAGTTGVASNAVNGKSFIGNDVRKTAAVDTGKKPITVICSGDLGTVVYACTAQLRLPEPISGGNRTLFLRLSAPYGKEKTDYRVTLLDSAIAAPDNGVQFSAVQPQIDSTGRANDLFRRVQTRVELTDVNFPYPEAAIDLMGDFCKSFSVTDYNEDYNEGDVGWSPCTP